MSSKQKLLEKILLGQSDANIDFTGLCALLNSLGFTERIKGSHHIFSKKGVLEIINVQPRGAKAKPYQIKQVRNLILNYHLRLEDSR